MVLVRSGSPGTCGRAAGPAGGKGFVAPARSSVKWQPDSSCRGVACRVRIRTEGGVQLQVVPHPVPLARPKAALSGIPTRMALRRQLEPLGGKCPPFGQIRDLTPMQWAVSPVGWLGATQTHSWTVEPAHKDIVVRIPENTPGGTRAKGGTRMAARFELPRRAAAVRRGGPIRAAGRRFGVAVRRGGPGVAAPRRAA